MPLILIIESGSTKTEWAIIGEKKTTKLYSPGWNPATIDAEAFQIHSSITPDIIQDICEIHYYGAGIRNNAIRTHIENKFRKSGFTSTISIESDLLGAARACCGQDSGWVGILGTGSNLGFYDGKTLTQPSPALGYILGDEGSGFQLGKQVLRQYFSRMMPAKVQKLFEEKFPVSVDEVIQNVYHGHFRNAYVASFAGFLSMAESEWTNNLLESVFDDFFTYKVNRFKESGMDKIHFCGSVACHFKNALEKAALRNGMDIGKVLASPMDELIGFHKKERFGPS